ncbi:hypothetical protein [Arthrobacter globiformis]|uniref:hypothetical protein n=1 Tax=Arthrobacter globiformis TaxID=1665 RepID=UPI0027D92D1F|nr:hypothetical protein [Arthrobacter globiformis]
MYQHRKPRALAQRVDDFKSGVSLVSPYRLACSPAQPQESIGEFHSALIGYVETANVVLIL